MTKPEEIQVLNKRVRLLQPVDGFRTSIDAILLAAACPAKDGQSILDLGCGVGTAGLCILTRVANTTLTGIDIQPDHIDLAIQNAALNAIPDTSLNAPTGGATKRTQFLPFPILDYVKSNGGEGANCPALLSTNGKAFDHVICNPPYFEAGEHITSPSASKATAKGHQDKDTTLKDWIDAGFHTVKSGGSFTIIHRADMTDKIIQALGKRFGATEIIPLWPKQGIPAKRVIIRTLKNRKSPATIHPGVVLHENNGDYTEEAEQILREMWPLA